VPSLPAFDDQDGYKKQPFFTAYCVGFVAIAQGFSPQRGHKKGFPMPNLRPINEHGCDRVMNSTPNEPGVTYGFGIVESADGHDVVAAREPPALAAMRAIAHPAMRIIGANDPHGGRFANRRYGAPWPETFCGTRTHPGD
jgi:hypothetical protein